MMYCRIGILDVWTNDAGNYTLLILFSTILLLNLSAIISTAYSRRGNSKLTNYMIIEFLCGNIVMSGAQIIEIGMQLKSPDKCQQMVLVYLFHQIGMHLSDISLLSINMLYCKMVLSAIPIQGPPRRAFVKKTIVIQAIFIITGTIFILVPLMIESKILHTLSISFPLILQFIAIGYCWKARIVFQNVKKTGHVTMKFGLKLKRDATWIQAASVITAFFKSLSVIMNIVIVTLDATGDIYRELKGVSMLYSISLVLLVIILAAFRRETVSLFRQCKRRQKNLRRGLFHSAQVHPVISTTLMKQIHVIRNDLTVTPPVV